MEAEPCSVTLGSGLGTTALITVLAWGLLGLCTDVAGRSDWLELDGLPEEATPDPPCWLWLGREGALGESGVGLGVATGDAVGVGVESGVGAWWSGWGWGVPVRDDRGGGVAEGDGVTGLGSSGLPDWSCSSRCWGLVGSSSRDGWTLDEGASCGGRDSGALGLSDGAFGPRPGSCTWD